MQDKVRELKDRLKNLGIYVNGLTHVKKLAEDAIRDTKWSIRKVCQHSDMSYAVGFTQNYDYDRTSERYHCKYCGVCETLFVIKAFGYCEKPKEEWSSQRDIDLSDFMYPFFIDRKTMCEDK